MELSLNGNDGCLSDRHREGLAPGPLPPGHRLGIRRRQAPQTAGLGRRVHRAHLPGYTLPDTPDVDGKPTIRKAIT